MTPKEITVPDWVAAYITAWKKVLPIQEWRIGLTLHHVIHGDPSILGSCGQRYNTQEADIKLRADIEEAQPWQETIIHELLHVAHAYVDQVVEEMIIQELPGLKQEMANKAYTSANEKFTNQVARVLWALKHGVSDNPPLLSTIADPKSEEVKL